MFNEKTKTISQAFDQLLKEMPPGQLGEQKTNALKAVYFAGAMASCCAHINGTGLCALLAEASSVVRSLKGEKITAEEVEKMLREQTKDVLPAANREFKSIDDAVESYINDNLMERLEEGIGEEGKEVVKTIARDGFLSGLFAAHNLLVYAYGMKEHCFNPTIQEPIRSFSEDALLHLLSNGSATFGLGPDSEGDSGQ